MKIFTKELNIKEKANVINKFQEQQVARLRMKYKINKKRENESKTDNVKEITDTIYIPEISVNKIIKYLNELDEGKSPGYDNVMTKHLKNSLGNSVVMLQIILNQIIEKEVIPDILKTMVYSFGDDLFANRWR